MTVVQRRVALLNEDGKFNDSMTPQAVLDAEEHCSEIAVTIDAHLAAMLAKSANLGDVPSPAAARVNLAAAAAVHEHVIADVTGLPDALNAKADLVGGVVPTSQIPVRALVTAVPVANQAAMLALTSTQVQPGDIAIRADGAGTWMLVEPNPALLGSWVLLSVPTDAVTTVNGQAGTVVLGAADVGAATPAQVQAAVDAVQILASGYAAQAAGSASSAASSATDAAAQAQAAHGDRLIADQDKADALVARQAAESARDAAAGSAATATGAAGTATSKAGEAAASAAALASLKSSALTNLVTNGGFALGTSGWTSAAGTLEVDEGVARGTASGSAIYSYIAPASSPSGTTGDLMYYRATVRALDAGASVLKISYSSNGATIAGKSSPAPGTWYGLSAVVALPASQAVIIGQYYADAATATGKRFEVDNVLAINLTATFGAGREPTAADIDALLSWWPGSWFDGQIDLGTFVRAIIGSPTLRRANNLSDLGSAAAARKNLVGGWDNMYIAANLYDRTRRTDNYFVSNTTGLLGAFATFYTSDYIPVTENTQYTGDYLRYVAFYTANKVFISGIGPTEPYAKTITTPAGAAYLRFSWNNASSTYDTGAIQLVPGTTLPPWRPFGHALRATMVDDTAGVIWPQVKLSDDVAAVVGDKLQIFKRGVLATHNPNVWPHRFVSTKGNDLGRLWEYTPAAGDVGTQTLKSEVLDLAGVVRSTATATVTVKTAANPASMVRVALIGDSLTAGDTYPAEVYRRLTQTGGSPAGNGFGNFTLVGPQALTAYPTQGRFANSGWTAQMYCSSGSPFWIGGALTVKGWFDANAAGVGPDQVVILLGWNGATLPASIAYERQLAATIHTEYPTCKILLLGLQQPPSMGTYGASGVYPDQSSVTRYVAARHDLLKAMAAETGWGGTVRYAALAPQFDTDNNMPTTATAVNTRNTTTELRVSNGVHPDTTGYLQIADLVYRELIRAWS